MKFVKNVKAVTAIIMGIGIILLLIGLFLKTPGTKLTTYSRLDGQENYSSIDEYVGGDAYNYIIGANLVGARITGVMVQKAIFIVSGIMLCCGGLVYFAIFEEGDPQNTNEDKRDLSELDAVSQVNLTSEDTVS